MPVKYPVAQFVSPSKSSKGKACLEGAVLFYSSKSLKRTSPMTTTKILLFPGLVAWEIGESVLL